MSSSASVRVCARFRPVNKVEREENAHVAIQIPQDTQVNVTRLGFEMKMFFLDHIFPPNATQANVYQYAGMPLVSEIMKGYNGTIFAYGQTGSGKTFTMQGELESDKMRGLVPRMVDAIFDSIMDADENLEFVIKVSYVEIYLERIRDLLETKNKNLKIRESSTQGIYIEGVSQPYVGSPEEIMSFIEQGSTIRSTSSHRMNDVSSRSHAVFIFRLIATHKGTQSKKMSKLMLVDLAGSEKTRKTQAEGKRLEEASQINSSLSALGLVIHALTSKKYVPYRNSKLTRLLTDSLGGNSKTCIIVTCSPCDYNVEETISTLRFGVNCKKVKNIPKINQELSISEYQTKLKKMTEREKALLKQIAALKSQVKALKAALIEAGGTNCFISFN
jgi:kinesin family protein 5